MLTLTVYLLAFQRFSTVWTSVMLMLTVLVIDVSVDLDILEMETPA